MYFNFGYLHCISKANTVQVLVFKMMVVWMGVDTVL